ncbi:hypothetical protein JOF53_005496 [Crossiella equi]|uniref:Uncharacterized protein n=1 Tax=Crossiella equi TaxID=130796 RepID=A0ABS5AJ79_9PSEU|nr:hypothetical protein [Crossiella equi]MBP2476624.1 hypothetical protein [Crossiella equi]
MTPEKVGAAALDTRADHPCRHGVVCFRLARVAAGSTALRAEFILIGAGMTSSTVFWLGVFTILLSGVSPLIGPLQHGLATMAFLLCAGMLLVPLHETGQRIAAARRYLQLVPFRHYLDHLLGEQVAPRAGLAELTLSIGYPPQARLHRLKMEIRDWLLDVGDHISGRRGAVRPRPVPIAETMERAGWQGGATGRSGAPAAAESAPGRSATGCRRALTKGDGR